MMNRDRYAGVEIEASMNVMASVKPQFLDFLNTNFLFEGERIESIYYFDTSSNELLEQGISLKASLPNKERNFARFGIKQRLYVNPETKVKHSLELALNIETEEMLSGIDEILTDSIFSSQMNNVIFDVVFPRYKLDQTRQRFRVKGVNGISISLDSFSIKDLNNINSTGVFTQVEVETSIPSKQLISMVSDISEDFKDRFDLENEVMSKLCYLIEEQ